MRTHFSNVAYLDANHSIELIQRHKTVFSCANVFYKKDRLGDVTYIRYVFTHWQHRIQILQCRKELWERRD